MHAKLSATAVGVALALGAGVTLAADNATIYQNGSNNDSSIEQYYNNNANATVTTYGNSNINVVVQEHTDNTSATILTNWANSNDNTIDQNLVENSSASVYQTSNGGTTFISQSGTGWGWHAEPGKNLSASIYQTGGGWGNDASIEQTGRNVSGVLSQIGYDNVGVITQHGTNGGYYGNTWTTAEMYQVGHGNDGTIEQDGRDLWAKMSQSGTGNVATISQIGKHLNAQVTQIGNFNTASVVQR